MFFHSSVLCYLAFIAITLSLTTASPLGLNFSCSILHRHVLGELSGIHDQETLDLPLCSNPGFKLIVPPTAHTSCTHSAKFPSTATRLLSRRPPSWDPLVAHLFDYNVHPNL
ncbi:hypothetical protein CPC08DRAFT_707207 [Agrocybe pediades]|nr:hypothetical protein CPC08DRAFT_707207 [Agrocybe pediades]